MRLKRLNSDFSTVIFDLDGTVVDSMWMWTDIDIEYLARFGKEFYPQIQRDIEGMSIKETALYFQAELHVPRSIEEMMQDWIDMSIEKYRNEVKLKPYAKEFLMLLKESGIKTGIATSNALPMVEACLKSNHVYELFDRIVSASDVERGKPHPDVYLHAAELLDASPTECVVFEDIPAGIIAGNAAGMETVAVHDKFSETLTDEKRKLANLYIRDFGELF